MGGTAKVLRPVMKTLTSKRTFPVGEISACALMWQKGMIAYERQLAERRGTPYANLNLIFPTTVGTILEKKTLRNAYKSLLKKAGLDEGYTFHDLRHATVTFMQSREVKASFKDISNRTGQKRRETIDRYSHIIESQAREAAERLDMFLSGFIDDPKEDGSKSDDLKKARTKEGDTGTDAK
jgi:site-specific recombinase XerD